MMSGRGSFRPVDLTYDVRDERKICSLSKFLQLAVSLDTHPIVVGLCSGDKLYRAARDTELWRRRTGLLSR